MANAYPVHAHGKGGGTQEAQQPEHPWRGGFQKHLQSISIGIQFISNLSTWRGIVTRTKGVGKKANFVVSNHSDLGLFAIW
jgi:hypothetical protein